MVKEFNTQTEVSVGLEILWQALSKDLAAIAPKVNPQLVKEVQMIEGDGGVGTILLFTLCSSGSTVGYQKEKISELDAVSREIGIEVVEGGYLNRGFSYFKTRFQLSAKAEDQTVVDVKIYYESENEEISDQIKTAESTYFHFFRKLEKYLFNSA
ncbi:phytohormone-binding protein-like isoform X2 [Prosopis cineraria]|uniref:phytohormone-binding protein-like isoform X2 n=1 Tax=Prosopis cineraria TaxID=364024 RepID=UPI00240FF924|nr:phytohormone-binding protein-like isoform X2 [Prosopis cineraria]